MKITDYEINEYNVKSAPDTLKAEGNVTARDIKHIFDRLPEYIVQKFNTFVDYVAGNFYTREQTEDAISRRVTEIGTADMQKAVYDSDNDGVVDNAKRLDGYGAAHFATKAEVQEAKATADGKAEASHTQTAGTITAGTFAGDVVAYSANRSTESLRNIEIRTDSETGALQSTNKIICVRK